VILSNLKDSTSVLLTLSAKYHFHKDKIQNYIAFLHTNNEHAGGKNQENNAP
jgi:hypothetical protein